MLKRASICVFKSCSRVDVDIDRNKWSDSQFFSLPMMAIWRCTFLTATLANKINLILLIYYYIIILLLLLYFYIIISNYYLLLFIIIIIFFIY